jgi:type IV pilus assembly protein PilC
MPVFEYEVVDRAGAVARGRQQADDQSQLMQRLRERGQLVVSLRATTDAPRTAAPLRQVLQRSAQRFQGRVKLNTLVLFTGQLAAMLEAGLHLVRILTAIAKEASDKRFAKIIEDIRDSLSAGASFSESLRLYPKVFSRLYVSAVHAGESSGALVVVLNSLTVHLEKAETLRRKVKGALAYPVAVLGVSAIIVVAMIVKIVPIFEGVYEKANAKLPAPTLVLVAISRVVRESAILTVLGLGLFVAATVFALRTERGRDFADKVKLRVPLFGSLIRKAVLARTCRTMSLLLQSGLPLLDALDIATNVAGNRTVERALVTVTQGVKNGATLADMMQQTGAFTSLVTQLVAAGEESGALAAMLGKAAVYYEAQVDSAVATLSTLVEPIMILLLGGIAGSVIFALYMPIFNLGDAMRGGIK